MSMPRIAGTGVVATPQKGCMMSVDTIAINNPKDTVKEFRKNFLKPGINGIRHISIVFFIPPTLYIKSKAGT